MRDLLARLLGEVDPMQRLGIFWLQCWKELIEALACDLIGVVREVGTERHPLGDHRLFRLPFRCLPPEVVSENRFKNGTQPCHRRRRVSDLPGFENNP